MAIPICPGGGSLVAYFLFFLLLLWLLGIPPYKYYNVLSFTVLGVSDIGYNLLFGAPEN